MDAQEIKWHNKVEALQNAVRHKPKDEDADAVVKTAEKYFAFLQGSAEKSE